MLEVNPRLVRTGLTLVAVGSAVSGVGGLLVVGALGLAARRWARAQEVPPSELAARRLAQLRAAVAAGTDEWRAQTPAGSSTGAGSY
ncbi:MAG TPA: hypothetical protein VFR99_00330 [Marmoricola sp.]|nr:hypothetical protein [Marmoricola sp.]